MTRHAVLRPERCRRCDEPFDERRYHWARGLCRPCAGDADRAGELADYPRLNRPRREVVTEWAHLRGLGCSMAEAAVKLGMALASFERALHRERAHQRAHGRPPGPLTPEELDRAREVAAGPRTGVAVGWLRAVLDHLDHVTAGEGR